MGTYFKRGEIKRLWERMVRVLEDVAKEHKGDCLVCRNRARKVLDELKASE